MMILRSSREVEYARKDNYLLCVYYYSLSCICWLRMGYDMLVEGTFEWYLLTYRGYCDQTVRYMTNYVSVLNNNVSDEDIYCLDAEDLCDMYFADYSKYSKRLIKRAIRSYQDYLKWLGMD